MLAIEKLKIKIESLKQNFNQLQEENRALKAELEQGTGEDVKALEDLKELLAAKETEIAKLKNEIREKDVEIEAIITKVETLLGN